MSREFRLVAASCAWPPDSNRHLVLSRLTSDVNWSLVGDLARRHRVEGLVWEALRTAGVAIPAEIADALRASALEGARMSLVQAAEAARLQGHLGQVGIQSLILKGTAVEILAYGRLGLKRAWDIDLMIGQQDVDGALGELRRLGYELTDPARLSPEQFKTWVELAKECELRHVDSGVTLELHWRLVDGPSMLPGLGLSSPTQDVRAGRGIVLTTFARDQLFSYLCVHGAMHGWSRLKWLADLAALLSQESLPGLEQLWRRSRELGAGHSSAQALLLCHDLLGLPLPPDLEDELRRSRTVRWLVRVAIDTMAGGGAAEVADRRFAATRILLSQLALGGSLRHAWSELRYRWVSLHDRVYVPLPLGLAFLYPILRLPLWLGRRLGLGQR